MKALIDRYIFSNRLSQQIFLFLLVGGVCYGVNMLLLILLVEGPKIEVNIANLLSSSVAIYIAYILNS